VQTFIIEDNLSLDERKKKEKKLLTVYSNVLKQMNAKLRKDLYRLTVEKEFTDAMVVGVDVCHAGRNSIVGMAATYSPHLT
jgi:hypothetical protein